MKLRIRKVNFTESGSLIVFASILSFLTFSAFAQVQTKFLPSNVDVNGKITGFSPKQGTMLRSSMARTISGSSCGKYIREKGWTEGFNNLSKNNEFALALGIASTEIKIGQPGFIDSRYVAFREAWMDANTKMAATLEKKILSEASVRLAPQTSLNKTEKSAADQAASLRKKLALLDQKRYQKPSLSSTMDKGFKWLNTLIDEDLRKRGIDIDAEKKARNESNQTKRQELIKSAKKAEEEAKKLLRTRQFDEIIEATAKERMKGIYTQYVSENLTTNNQYAQICVVLRYSRKSERLADAMAARNFSGVPTLFPNRPIRDQLPNPNNQNELFDLINSWGLTIKVDENGHVNLISYGQSEVDRNDSSSIIAAKTNAKLAAENLLRLFINQTVALQEASKTSQDVRTYKNKVAKVQLNRSARKKMEQGAGFAKINGIHEVLDWQAPHPVTSQGIYGVIVSWNANKAAGARKFKHQQNTTDPTKIPNNEDKALRYKEDKFPLRRGKLSGSTESQDF